MLVGHLRLLLGVVVAALRGAVGGLRGLGVAAAAATAVAGLRLLLVASGVVVFLACHGVARGCCVKYEGDEGWLTSEM